MFGDFGDYRGSVWGDKRRQAVRNHPLKSKIKHLNLTESNYWRDNTKGEEHKKNFDTLVEELKKLKPSEVVTHNAYGEYGHLDHILVFNACMEVFDCKVNGKDPVLYRKIKKVYAKKGAWTWY